MIKTANIFLLFSIQFVFSISYCIAQTRKDQSVQLVDKNVTYETPKVYELMHIAMALTDTSIISNGYNVYHEVIDTSTAYYKEVIRHYGAFRNHKLIVALNASLQKNASNYVNHVVKGYNAGINDGDIKKVKVMPWVRRVVYASKGANSKQVEDFAEVTNFEAFYENHRGYYNEVLENVKRLADVNHQQAWLEQHFPARYGKYNIVVSPLMYGTHFTQRFRFDGVRKSVMWVGMPDYPHSLSENIKAGRYTGVVMTEIDHNYVNPVSDTYKKALNSLMGDEHRTKWTGGSFSNVYKSGYKVFNEYMTHSVYLLYTSEKYTEDEQLILEKLKIESMVNTRKFINFGHFYNELKRLYTNRKSGEKIEDLYPAIIEWCKQQNIE